MKKIAFILFVFCCGFSLSGQTINELYLMSSKAHKYKDYNKFLETTKQLDSLRPMHPTYTYNLACAYALTGNPEKAFAPLEKAIMMNSKTDFVNDEDLVSLKGLPDYDRMIKLNAEMEKQIATSVKNVSLSEKFLHPEGLVYLKKSKTWLASSIRQGKIVSFNIKNGKSTDWLKEDGMYSVFAMKPDAAEKYLWVATSVMPEMSGYTREIDGKAVILKVDIRTKKIVARYTALGRHVFGDLIVAKNGTVYISDSFGASLYKIDSEEITHWIDLPAGTYNLQGITFNGDETKVYVADYFNGILEIPMANISNHKWLDFPKGTVKKGIDGLTWYKNSLIAVHNGVKPIRIVEYQLDASGENITGFKTIDNNRPEFNEPALGIVKDQRFYFFANCPWNAYDKKHNLDETQFENPMLYSFELEQ